jgi:hypothetical protein
VNIGAENKKQVRLMAALLAVLALVFFYNFKDSIWGTSASAHPSTPVTQPQQPKTASAMPASDGSDPRLRLDILDGSRRVKYEAGGRNIFAMGAIPIPTPEGSIRTANPTPPPPPPTPPPPPKIPLLYYGYANKPGEPRKIFLQPEGGGQVFIAEQGQIVNRRYRVVQIQPNQVLMEDVLTNNRQPIPLTVK